LASVGLLLLTGAGIEQPLGGLEGDPVRGEKVVIRQASTCTLCHAGPFPNPHLQGNVGPDLHGVGARLSRPELRERLVDASRMNPATVMPSFFRTEGLTRVGAAWRGKPILSAQEIEDAVAYLATLKQ
jgi:sulfur-oxidizing protein SoxX